MKLVILPAFTVSSLALGSVGLKSGRAQYDDNSRNAHCDADSNVMLPNSWIALENAERWSNFQQTAFETLSPSDNQQRCKSTQLGILKGGFVHPASENSDRCDPENARHRTTPEGVDTGNVIKVIWLMPSYPADASFSERALVALACQTCGIGQCARNHFSTQK